MQVRHWRNKKGWQLSLLWVEKQGGSIRIFNPRTKETHVLREYEYWQGFLATQTAELVAAWANAEEVVVPNAA